MRLEVIERFGRRDRDRENEVTSPALAKRLERGARGAARREAIVDDDHRPPAHVDGRPPATVRVHALRDLALLLRDEHLELLLGDTHELHRVAVDIDGAFFRYGANAELGLNGSANLAHDAHIERGRERTRDLVRDRNAAAWKAENHWHCAAIDE